MSSFRDRFRVIPTPAWVIALLFAACSEILLWQLAFQTDHQMKSFDLPTKLLLSTAVAVFVAGYVLLIGYVSGDAKRRGMRQTLWTLIAIFVPNCMGIILYFFLREPILASCPKCGTVASSTFAFCHQCGTEIFPACPGCRRPTQANWKSCAYCGTDLTRSVPPTSPSGNPVIRPGSIG